MCISFFTYNINVYAKDTVYSLNKYNDDNNEDIEFIKNYTINEKVKFAVSTSYKDGGNGALKLAEEVLKLHEKEQYHQLYDIHDTIEEKINTIIKEIYHANNICYSELSLEKIKNLKNNNLDKLPICIAKTQYSISDNPKLLGNPYNYSVTVKDIKL